MKRFQVLYLLRRNSYILRLCLRASNDLIIINYSAKAAILRVKIIFTPVLVRSVVRN